MNNALSGDVLTYNGGGDDRWGTDDGTRGMPSLVMSRLEQFQGQMSPTAIAQQLMKTEGRQIGYFKDIGTTNAAASEINRQLAASLNSLSCKSVKSDIAIPPLNRFILHIRLLRIIPLRNRLNQLFLLDLT